MAAENGWRPEALLSRSSILWKANIGKGHSTMVVRGDRVYTAGNREIAAGSQTTITLGSGLKIPEGGMCLDNDGACLLPGAGAIRLRELHGTNTSNTNIFVAPDDGEEDGEEDEGLSSLRATCSGRPIGLGRAVGEGALEPFPGGDALSSYAVRSEGGRSPRFLALRIETISGSDLFQLPLGIEVFRAIPHVPGHATPLRTKTIARPKMIGARLPAAIC